ncbi:MAG TPA: hypothetical protein VMF07_10480 [Solirubrobacteraceae bacterium]|nr:hypothetical protein [Solirubrobacteraceae bacterium]
MALSRIPPSAIARCTAIGLLTLLTATCSAATASSTTIGSKRTCIYSASSVSTLAAAGAMLGVDFTCALVYDDAAQTWAQWDDPWFITDPDPDGN